MLAPKIDHTEKRERIYIVKACIRHIVHSCRIRMEEDQNADNYQVVRSIQRKYGEYLYSSLEQTPVDELEKILVDTPAIIKRVLDPTDALDGMV